MALVSLVKFKGENCGHIFMNALLFIFEKCKCSFVKKKKKNIASLCAIWKTQKSIPMFNLKCFSFQAGFSKHKKRIHLNYSRRDSLIFVLCSVCWGIPCSTEDNSLGNVNDISFSYLQQKVIDETDATQVRT